MIKFTDVLFYAHFIYCNRLRRKMLVSQWKVREVSGNLEWPANWKSEKSGKSQENQRKIKEFLWFSLQIGYNQPLLATCGTFIQHDTFLLAPTLSVIASVGLDIGNLMYVFEW